MLSLKDRLTELLINNKLLSQDQLDQALDAQKQKGGRLSEIIVKLGFIRETDLMLTISQGLGLPLMDLKRFRIDAEIVKMIPVEIARNYQIVPISKMGDTITLAMADPLNIFAIDHVESLTGFKINPIIAQSQDIAQTIESTYPDATGGVIDELVQEMAESSIEVVRDNKEADPSDQDLDRVSREVPVIKVTNMILDDAVKKRASDVLIEPMDKKIRVRFRVDGMLIEQQSPPRNMLSSIVSRIKVMANLNIAEHRLPQDGRFKVKMAGREVDFRISILPTNLGEKVALRVLDKSQANLDIEKMGFHEMVVSSLKKVAKMPHGMMLVCGPTGSGKTTTLYSILKFVDAAEKNLVTVEDPVEFQLEGINQVTVRPDIGLTFAAALRSILRQDPNIIMIGEIRDFETVDIAIKSALTGHLVISTLHTTTAPGAIVRLVNMGVEPYLIDSSLVCVLSQRLVRKICKHCKEEVEIKKEVLDALKIATGMFAGRALKFYKGKGCAHCGNIGYAGRIGIAELLILSSRIRELVMERAQEHMIKSAARKEGMITLRESGLDLVFNGVTTLEEILRVTAPDDQGLQEPAPPVKEKK